MGGKRCRSSTATRGRAQLIFSSSVNNPVARTVCADLLCRTHSRFVFVQAWHGMAWHDMTLSGWCGSVCRCMSLSRMQTQLRWLYLPASAFSFAPPACSALCVATVTCVYLQGAQEAGQASRFVIETRGQNSKACRVAWDMAGASLRG
jgi:hypothetical protein